MHIRSRRVAHGLLLAAGIVLSSLIAVHAARGWIALAPLMLALTALAASALDAAARGEHARPSAAALIMAAALPLACWLLAREDARELARMLPVLGISAWAALLPETPRRRAACRHRGAS